MWAMVSLCLPHAALTTHPRSKEFDRDNVSVAISYVDRYSCRNPDVSGDRLLVVSSVAIYLAVKLSQSVKLAVRAGPVSDIADEYLHNMP